jgi:hypothetical protein
VRPTTTWVVGRPLREALAPTARRARGPTAAQGSMRSPQKQSDREGKPGLTSENRAWACQDLNLGPHPYQVSPAERCAIQPFPRPRYSVDAAGMG